MNPEIIIATWLQDATVSAVIGDRYASPYLPSNSEFPALVYNLVDATPQPFVAAQGERELAQCRFQFNPISTSIGEVKQIADVLRSLFDFKHHQTIAGKLVVSMRLIDAGPMEKDSESGLFMQRFDYRMFWYET